MRSMPWVDDVLRDRVPPWQAVGASPTEVLELCAALEISELVHHRVTRGGRPATGQLRLVASSKDERVRRGA